MTKKKVEVDPKTGKEKVIEENHETVKSSNSNAKDGVKPSDQRGPGQGQGGTMMNAISIVTVLFVGATACSGTSRGLEAYRTDTQNLLATRDAQVKSCYDDALKTDAKLTGTVTVGSSSPRRPVRSPGPRSILRSRPRPSRSTTAW